MLTDERERKAALDCFDIPQNNCEILDRNFECLGDAKEVISKDIFSQFQQAFISSHIQLSENNHRFFSPNMRCFVQLADIQVTAISLKQPLHIVRLFGIESFIPSTKG
ncbi:hypothetical protein ACTXT7_002321 [Hymenolepis weldensis]